MTTKTMGQHRLAAPDGKPARTWAAARQVWNARWKAKHLGLPVGDLNWIQVARLYYLPCAYCGVVPAMGADHVVPLARGGENTLSNMTPACQSCNNAKSGTAGWRKKKPWPCRLCGQPISHVIGRKDPIYCSDACRGVFRRQQFLTIQFRAKGQHLQQGTRLSPEQVAQFRAEYRKHDQLPMLATRYGISTWRARMIAEGKYDG